MAMPRAACTSMASERAHFVQGGDAAGGGDFERRGGAQTAKPVEVGALHHAFLIDVGAEETGAVGLERAQHLLGGEIGGLLPALDYDAAVFGIERNDEPVAADGVAHGGEERSVDARLGKRRRAHDHFSRSLFDQGPRPLDRSHAAADARGRATGKHAHQAVVRAAAHGGVEIDDLNFGERGEALAA